VTFDSSRLAIVSHPSRPLARTEKDGTTTMLVRVAPTGLLVLGIGVPRTASAHADLSWAIELASLRDALMGGAMAKEAKLMGKRLQSTNRCAQRSI
jgi:hypothetical protein